MGLIENLLNLFRVDGQVRSLRTRLQSAERYLNGQTKQLNDLLQQQQELQTRRRHLQATSGAIEVEIKSVDERLEKLRTELNSASNNKQYAAILTELNTVKELRAQLEDRELAEMEQVEGIEKQLAALEVQVAERSKVRGVAQSELDQRTADVGQRLSELESERATAAAIIPPDAMAIFDDLADIHEGEAMSGVEEIDRKRREYTCAACNMHLPFEQVAMLSSKSDALIRCPTCGRLLYMQEDMRGSLAKK